MLGVILGIFLHILTIPIKVYNYVGKNEKVKKAVNALVRGTVRTLRSMAIIISSLGVISSVLVSIGILIFAGSLGSVLFLMQSTEGEAFGMGSEWQSTMGGGGTSSSDTSSSSDSSSSDGSVGGITFKGKGTLPVSYMEKETAAEINEPWIKYFQGDYVPVEDEKYGTFNIYHWLYNGSPTKSYFGDSVAGAGCGLTCDTMCCANYAHSMGYDVEWIVENINPGSVAAAHEKHYKQGTWQARIEVENAVTAAVMEFPEQLAGLKAKLINDSNSLELYDKWLQKGCAVVIGGDGRELSSDSPWTIHRGHIVMITGKTKSGNYSVLDSNSAHWNGGSNCDTNYLRYMLCDKFGENEVVKHTVNYCVVVGPESAFDDK